MKKHWSELIQVPFSMPGLTALDPRFLSNTALAPLMGRETLAVHYGTLMKGYLKRLQSYVHEHGHQAFDVWGYLGAGPEQPFSFDLGGFVNHTIFFNELCPPHVSKAYPRPGGRLGGLIESNWGDFDRFRAEFTQACLELRGSGWIWLIHNSYTGRMGIVETVDQQNPLMFDSDAWPVLGCDMWEHAYFLDYKARKKRWVDAFFGLVDWRHLEKAMEPKTIC